MTAEKTPARVLLAALIDEATLETAPAEAIAADAAALGCDAVGLVAFARELAAGGTSPSATLLRRLVEDDDTAAEIDRLERADAAAIRARLPRGTVAALVGLARRAAPAGPPPRSRPRRWLPAGIVTALAASLLLVIVLRPFDALRDSALVADVELRPSPVREVPSGGAGPADGPADRTVPSIRGQGPTARLALADAGEAGLPAPLVTRLLVVDPNLAPAVLLDTGYVEGGLAGRLGDARRASGGWPVVALIGAEGPDGPFDAAIMALPPELSLYEGAVRPPSVLAGLLGDRAHRFALARLPPN
ncbi:MAG: hypothetical protein HKM95_03835 [Inquilinus sp.]|nr:hypothetical protein [Inquilinus sp.]